MCASSLEQIQRSLQLETCIVSSASHYQRVSTRTHAVCTMPRHLELTRTNSISPEREGFFIFLVYGHKHPLLRKLVHLGGELPSPLARIFLEVVAEAEVSEHLEERMVPGCDSHVFYVVCSDALLGCCGPRNLPRPLAEKYRLELQHTWHTKQQSDLLRGNSLCKESLVWCIAQCAKIGTRHGSAKLVQSLY